MRPPDLGIVIVLCNQVIFFFPLHCTRMHENSEFLRILNPRCKDHWKEGCRMSEASRGALLIAKKDLPKYGAKRGDIFICTNCYTPERRRGSVSIWDSNEKILEFINKAWYRQE